MILTKEMIVKIRDYFKYLSDVQKQYNYSNHDIGQLFFEIKEAVKSKDKDGSITDDEKCQHFVRAMYSVDRASIFVTEMDYARKLFDINFNQYRVLHAICNNCLDKRIPEDLQIGENGEIISKDENYINQVKTYLDYSQKLTKTEIDEKYPVETDDSLNKSTIKEFDYIKYAGGKIGDKSLDQVALISKFIDDRFKKINEGVESTQLLKIKAQAFLDLQKLSSSSISDEEKFKIANMSLNIYFKLVELGWEHGDFALHIKNNLHIDNHTMLVMGSVITKKNLLKSNGSKDSVENGIVDKLIAVSKAAENKLGKSLDFKVDDKNLLTYQELLKSTDEIVQSRKQEDLALHDTYNIFLWLYRWFSGEFSKSKQSLKEAEDQLQAIKDGLKEYENSTLSANETEDQLETNVENPTTIEQTNEKEIVDGEVVVIADEEFDSEIEDERESVDEVMTEEEFLSQIK